MKFIITLFKYKGLLFYRDPRVNILKSEVIKNPAAPAVASFSARGPNLILPDIIKVLCMFQGSHTVM